MDQQDETGAQATENAAAGKFSKAKDFVGEKYTAASDAMKNKYGDVREKVAGKYGEVKDKVQEIDYADVMEKGRAYVRSNPGKALLISIGVGFVIGLLLRRGNDD